MMKIATVFVFIALNYYVYAYLGSREVIPERASFDSFPLAFDDWKCAEMMEMDPESLDVLGATDYVICNYVSHEARTAINLYIGYHASQVRKYSDEGDRVNVIHPPEHCLPGSGWDVIDASTVPIESGVLSGLAKRFVIAKGDSRQLVYFWYQSRGRIIARNHEVILFKFWDRATKGRSDGALVRLTTPIVRGDEATADSVILEFAAASTPSLARHLPN